MLPENDPFYYAGPRKWQRGYVAIELEILNRGPFRYRVRAVPKAYLGYLGPLSSLPVETFYYLTWTGFLDDWKRNRKDK